MAVWSSVYAQGKTDTLRVYFLDVGQGDAIFIDSPTHGRVLIDGGPDRRVLSELGRILPFGDRRIDAVIATHPDADHITGLVEVFERFEVGAYIEPGVESENKIDDMLRDSLAGTPRVLARRGMHIDLGGGAKLLILYPNTDVSRAETNEASVVTKLVYGDKSFLLTGDSTKNTEYLLLALNGEILNADVMQAGHHGSDTSTSLLFANTVTPEYAVISAGKNNRYGHPHKTVLETLGKTGAQILKTFEHGTIAFETDGENLVLK